jgi:hypothetical protein
MAGAQILQSVRRVRSEGCGGEPGSGGVRKADVNFILFLGFPQLLQL